jgi:parallel beta-helix repeat protein
MIKYTKSLCFIVLIVFSYMQNAWAVECGDIVTSDVVLTEDLHCATGYAALEVFANDVTIDLNGFTLSGTSELAGVLMNGFDNLTVKNGSIYGFYAGVNANQTNTLKVQNMTFYELGFGITSNVVNGGILKNNAFIRTDFGVLIKNSDALTTANTNRIHNNEFFENQIGIDVCGNHADDNFISDNLIWKTSEYGIRLRQAESTRITGNHILESGESAILLNESSYSAISHNTLRSGKKGLSIVSNATASCLAGDDAISFKNRFRSNYVLEFETGVQLGLGFDGSPSVFKNNVTLNKIYDDETGILFESDAHENTTGNGFQGTITPIIDYGTGNIH